MRILMVLNYYFPYISGLSEYCRRISEELVKKGHQVTVVTSRHDGKLPREETINRVNVVRCGYLFRIGKGLVGPSFILTAVKEAEKHDRVNLHLPMFEAGILQLLIGRKSVITYHSDLRLGKGPVDGLVERLYYLSAAAALNMTKRVITYTQDYAKASRLLRNHVNKCRYITPVVDEAHFRRVDSSEFKKKYRLKGKKVVGFAGRFVYEKGLLHLLMAIPLVLKEMPDTVFVFAGEYARVAGGSIIHELSDMIGKHKGNIVLLGNVAYEKLPEFYSACDVLVLPSIDPLEAFGIVQLESMYCGTPLIATDLPGARVPVQKTGMGLVIPKKNEAAIAEAIKKILKKRSLCVKSRATITKFFGKEKAIRSYAKALREEP
ncbi:glycosyltransferase family 4 protein [Candidatus Woesearchaeota archaeon]|nr:glycosyltransferase family 4 protein [Candidatus Woesearchaeota archaeon]